MIVIDDLRVGDRLQSTDSRDAQRVVRVIELHHSVAKVRVENVATERRTFLRTPLVKWEHAT